MGNSGTWKIHYAWVIVAIASVMGMISSSVRFAAGALVPYLQDPEGAFGWSYSAITFGFSLQWLVSGVVSPYIGWLGDRYGVRRILLLGAFLFIAGMLFTGIMTQPWEFYLFFGVVLGVATTVFSILLITGVALWFRKYLGMAMAAVWSFQGTGTLVFIFLIGAAFNFLGIKWIFWLPGLVGEAILLLLIRPFYNEPSEIGLRPFGALGDEPIRKLQNDNTAKIRARVFLRQAQRTGTFWNLIGIHYWGCMGHNIINVLLAAIAVDRGLSPAAASGVLAVLAVTGMVTRGAVPLIADRMGSKGVWVIGFSLQAFPLLILLVAHDAWAFYLVSFLSGIGQGCEVPTFPIANRQYYGNVPQGSLYGWQNIGNGLGMGMSPVLAGFLWDRTGNYVFPLIMSVMFSLVGLFFVLLLPSPRCCLIADWEKALPAEARSLA